MQFFRQLESYFDAIDSDFTYLKTKYRELLQEEEELNEIVQLVGRDSLSEDQKLILEVFCSPSTTCLTNTKFIIGR